VTRRALGAAALAALTFPAAATAGRSATRDYVIETSTGTVDGPRNTVAVGSFGDDARPKLTAIPAAQPPAPTPTPTPPAVSPPSFSLPARGRTTVKFKVTCAAPCDVTAKLTVDRPTAKKLGLGKVLTAGSLSTRVDAGKTTLTLKLKSKARKALLKGPKARTYRARLKATASYGPGTRPVSRSRQLTLKR
jgi:hypothetical protein